MNNTDTLFSALHFYLSHDFKHDLLLKNYIVNLFIAVYGEQADTMSFDDIIICLHDCDSYLEYLEKHNFK